jgi:hypothetical protein
MERLLLTRVPAAVIRAQCRPRASRAFNILFVI